MTSNLGKEDCVPLPQVRIILIGGRWSGKSSSGNTILRKERFQCGRTRTAQSELRQEEVEGRHLVVVDAPGWSSSPSLTEIPEVDKQRFKLNVSKCPPGPHAFLLVIPIDSAFGVNQRRPLEEHMKLLGERAWRNTMVLFTCGDFLGDKTVEQHIESEGDALGWLVKRCGNRYHVFTNKDKGNSAQVTLLLEKIDEMVWDNEGGCYEVDERTLRIIEDKQREVATRARERQRKAEEQRQQLLIPEASKAVPELRVVLLGSRGVGKSSVGNTILGIKDQKDGKRTVHSVVRNGIVDKTAVTLVDTPGWWKGYSASDTPELIKQEVMCGMFLCPPGPHVFLLVIDADASFNKKHRDAVKGHLELLGEDVWKHTMVVFTRGDWLGKKTIEEHIEGEGEALQSLVDKCGNRYHVVDNKNTDDGTQVTEMLEKISEIAAGNSWNHFVPDEKIFVAIEEKRKKVEEGVKLRLTQVKTRRENLKRSRNQLQEIRIVMLGQKTVGKSAAGNTILRKEVFSACENDYCEEGKGEVAGRLVTVIDTPGWWKSPSQCTEKLDKEMVRGVSLCPPGAHALLLVIPSDMAFTEVQQRALEEHVRLFDDSVWKHTLVLFTYGDMLADIAIEGHIEREKYSLQWLVEKCGNRYHVFNNTKNDATQVTQLLEKIEEMVAGNSGRLFSPDMNYIRLRIEEKFRRREIKEVLKRRLESEYRRRELELMAEFRQTLIDLQAEIRGSDKTTKQKLTFGETKIKAKGLGQVKKDAMEKEEKIQQKFSQEIEKLNKGILRSTDILRSSREFNPPSFSGDSPASSVAGSLPDRRLSTSKFDQVLGWLSTLHIGRTVEDQLTLNFSQTSSGYRSQPEREYLDPNRGLQSLFERDSES